MGDFIVSKSASTRKAGKEFSRMEEVPTYVGEADGPLDQIPESQPIPSGLPRKLTMVG